MKKDIKESEKNLAGFNKLSRRDFLHNGTVVAGGLLLSPVLTGTGITFKEAGDKTLQWFDKPLCIMHTVLRETDAKNYNADAVVEYLQKDGCNTLCLNAGGIVDFFQNPLPAANVNRFMGDRDILKEITTACKSAGIKVIARIDFRGSEEHIYNKFPDWYMKDVDQNPVVSTGSIVPIYASCYLGKYRNEYANEFVSYVMENYAVDGIWHNAPGISGICYCPRCQAAYKSASGKNLPLMKSSPVSELDGYMVWKAQVADQYMDRIKKTTKSFGEDKAYTAEVFSHYNVEGRVNFGIDLYSARKHFDILVSVAFLADADPDHYYSDLKYGNSIITFLKSMAPKKEAVVMWGGNGTTHRLVIDPTEDLKIWLWEILSVGGRFWNCYFTNVPTLTNDNRNAYLESEAHHLVKANAKLYEQHVPVANVGIYYSGLTRISYREKGVEGDRFGTDIKGLITVLMENHIQYDFILDDQISKERLGKYKLVLLPNVRCLSGNEIELLGTYVRDGGNLLATYATSLYDANGKERKDYGLAEIFGVHYTGRKLNTQSDNYQYILNPEHPLVSADSPKTELLFNAGYTLLCKPVKESGVICTLTPVIRNQPPDKSWVEKFSTEHPTIVENTYGKGKVLYFSNQPDVLSYTIGHPDPRNLLARGLRYLAGNTLPVESTAPSSVHIGLTKSLLEKGNYILSLVNTTSGPVRPIRELIPVNNIEVKLQLEGKSLNRHAVLRSQGDCNITSKGQVLDIRISKLEDFCAIHIKMNV